MGEGECEGAVQVTLLQRDASSASGCVVIKSTQVMHSAAAVLRRLFLCGCISSPSAPVLELRLVIFLLFFVILLPLCSSLNIYLTLLFKILCLVAKSYLTLFDPMDCSPPGSSVHGIFQARILEWIAISFSLYKYYIFLSIVQ